jgi:hypothetical protein
VSRTAFFDPTLAGATCYPVFWSGGQVYNAGSYENFSAAHWAAYASAVSPSADGNGGFGSAYPAGFKPGFAVWCQQAGGSPADTDAPVYQDDVGGKVLDPTGLDQVVVEAGLNARQALAINTASLAGVVAGALTTLVTIAAAGAGNAGTNRITAVVDNSGNRTAVTLNVPA